MKTAILLSAFASLAVRVLADMPPGCLLSAVNEQPQPTDLPSICGKEATNVQSAIASLCPTNFASAAQSAFIATCSGAGSSVAAFTATSNSSASSTKSSGPKTSSGTFVYTTAVYNADCSCTSTVVSTATTASVDSTGLATATGGSATNSAGVATATGNAANAEARQLGSFAAAVIAIAGVVAVL